METISVIIPAYNEENYIKHTLKSIQIQDYPFIEIIVVCNGCTDRTEQIAREYTDKVIIIKEKNVAIARNIGAESAKGKFLAFIDADTTLSSDVISVISSKLKQGSFFGTIKAIPPKRIINVIIYTETKNIINLFVPWSNGIVYCTKEAFLKTDGFNPYLSKGELAVFFKEIKKHATYARLNTAKVITSQRRIASWGLLKLSYYWIKNYIRNIKEDYEVIR